MCTCDRCCADLQTAQENLESEELDAEWESGLQALQNMGMELLDAGLTSEDISYLLGTQLLTWNLVTKVKEVVLKLDLKGKGKRGHVPQGAMPQAPGEGTPGASTPNSLATLEVWVL